MKFDKRQTNIAKGMALLLLLWHHVFYKSEEYYGLFRTVGTIDGVPFESCVARYFKVCVAIFFFLSSFGMYKSWQNLRRRAIRSEGRLSAGAQVRFVKNHLIKVMMDFWFIYLIFVPLGMAFGVYFREVYEGSFGNGLLDFLCLSFFSRTPSMNPTWWFMSLVIAFYLQLPLLARLTEKVPEIVLGAAFFFMLIPDKYFPRGVMRYTEWIPPLLMGLLFARFGWFERVQRRYAKLWQGALLTVPAIALFAYLRFMTEESVRYDALFAAAILFFSYLVLSRVPLLGNALEWLGSYSGPIYMFHTFVYLIYGRDLIYWFAYPPLTYAVMLAVCLLIAVGLKYFKKLIRFDRLTAALTR